METTAGTADLITALSQLGLAGGVLIGLGVAFWFLRQRSVASNGGFHRLAISMEAHLAAGVRDADRMLRIVEMEKEQNRMMGVMVQTQERIALTQQHTIETMRDLAGEIVRNLAAHRGDA